MTIFVTIMVTALALFAFTSECRFCKGPVLGKSKLCRRCRPIQEQLAAMKTRAIRVGLVDRGGGDAE